MRKGTAANVKLGIFVLAGLFFLILVLYMIGKNENLFGSTFPLKARFSNVHGLTAGNNVRYAGIQAGTVKKVDILNDTTIEVTMQIETSMKNFIKKNAIATISTDGLMGNMVVNISPGTTGSIVSELVQPNDILPVQQSVELNDMIQVLAKSSGDIADVVSNLKETVIRFNNNSSLWEVLEDKQLPAHLRASLLNTRNATTRAEMLVSDLQELVRDVRQGKGSLGKVLTDTALVYSLQGASEKINKVAAETDSLAITLRIMTSNLKNDLEKGKGPVNPLLHDSILTGNIQMSVENIRRGTEQFNQVMEALKHNFLLRGYFRKQERQKQRLQ